MNNWTIRNIAVWQEDTFEPSVKSQRDKSILEAKEYFKAKKSEKNRKGELIDYIITKCWLAYFKRDYDALMVLEMAKMIDEKWEIQKGINEKMRINLEREWKKTQKGEWRHVENDEKNNVRRANTLAKAKSVGNGNDWQ